MIESHPITLANALQAWQVIPQTDGFAEVSLSGSIRLADGGENVFCRVVSERNGADVVPWCCAERNAASWKKILVIPTGGPYRIETCAKTADVSFADAVGGDMVQHLFVGDLYLIAGQSNAVGYARDCAQDAPCIGVSVFRANGKWDLASHPLNDGTDTVRTNLDVPLPAHSPWLAFGKTVYRATGIPIGLLPAAIGGSPIQPWLPGQIMFQNALELLRDAGEVKGVIWYQGCADALAADTEAYAFRFRQMVAGFRSALNRADLPFFTLQLNGYTPPVEKTVAKSFDAIRAIQEELAHEDGIYLLPTAGMKLCDQIHNSARSNLLLGRQIAAIALKVLYGLPCRAAPPALTGVIAGSDCLELVICPVEGHLIAEPCAKKAFCALRNGERLTVDRVIAAGNKLILTGKSLHLADSLSYAQGADLTNARIHDSRGGWMLLPFTHRM